MTGPGGKRLWREIVVAIDDENNSMTVTYGVVLRVVIPIARGVLVVGTNPPLTLHCTSKCSNLYIVLCAYASSFQPLGTKHSIIPESPALNLMLILFVTCRLLSACLFMPKQRPSTHGELSQCARWCAL